MRTFLQKTELYFPTPRAQQVDRPRSNKEANNENAYLSARGGFSQYLRRNTTFPSISYKITLPETAVIIQQLLNALVVGDLVKIIDKAKNGDNVNGYQIPASALIWRAGDGTKAFHDPISVPRLSDGGGRTNHFFVEFYQGFASKLLGLEAHEHTAQVPSTVREEREQRFRSADLPILYCSPTMELGVDITELNAVNKHELKTTLNPCEGGS